MSHIEKPMLAAKAPEDLSVLRFPLLCSPKLDGVRCVIREGKALTRTFKPIPNDHVRSTLEAAGLPDGLDGELMLADWTAPFKELSGAVRRKTGEPDFTFAAFDLLNDAGPEQGFQRRYEELERAVFELSDKNPWLFRVRQWTIEDVTELEALHATFLTQGFEGTMLRTMSSPYKFGRATTKSQWLLKLKNWADEEAEVIGFEEQMHNGNVATRDKLGRTKRSTHAENKTGKGTLGALRCRFPDGAEFGVGTGMDDAMKQEVWDDQAKYLGATAKIKHQPDPGGRQPGQAPRIPVFLGWRWE